MARLVPLKKRVVFVEQPGTALDYPLAETCGRGQLLLVCVRHHGPPLSASSGCRVLRAQGEDTSGPAYVRMHLPGLPPRRPGKSILAMACMLEAPSVF